MLTMERNQATDMRDLEREFADSRASRRNPEGEPLAGLYTLTRQMETEEEDQFDVDLTILDFLAYKATNLVFEWKASSNCHRSDLPSALATMTAEWRTFMKHKHSSRRLNSQAAFRSRLLQFVLVFSHRLNHDKTWTTEESLNGMRAQNKSRGSYWQQRTSHAPALRQQFDVSNEFPLSDGALAVNRHKLASALDMPVDRRRWVNDVEGTPSLHCLLPLFMELTAARVNLGDWVASPEWLHLAGQFMIQAVLEEYLRNGAFGEEPFETIFSFGCPGTQSADDDGPDVKAMRKLFCTEESPHEQVHGWAKTRRQYINELLPQQGSASFLQSLESAQERFSYSEFEDSVLSFLWHLHDGLTNPDLVQVEEGKITLHGVDLSEADSKDMIRRMGL